MGLVERLRVLIAFWIITKIKNTFCWQNGTAHAYQKACIYLHCGPSTKIPSKLKSIRENGVS